MPVKRRTTHLGAAGVMLSILAAGAAAAATASPATSDGRYHLLLEGAEAPPLLILERCGGRWAPSLAGQFGQGQGQVLARGIVHTAERRGEGWRVAVHLLLGGLPRKRDWLVKDPPTAGEAELTFQVRDGALSGAWKATIGGRSAGGRIAGHVEPLCAWPLRAAPKVGEHPRFLLRKEDLPALRAKARTPSGKWGEAMLKRLEEPGWSRSGMAVAQGLLYQVTGERKHADKARELIDADIRSGWWKAIGPIHDPAHKATEAMFAYDLIHDTCDAAYHARMRDFLRGKMRFFWDYAEINSGNGHPHSNWSAQYRSAVGMVALVLLAEAAPALPPEPEAWDFAKVSPPAAFKVAAGMPVLPIDDAPLRKWLLAGPLNIGLEHDGLASLGGAASAYPTAGTTFRTKVKARQREDGVSGKYRMAILFKNARPRPKNKDVQGDDLQPLTEETTATFAPVPEDVVVAENEYIERGIGRAGMIHAWRAAGLRSFQTLYFFAVIDNPAPRHLQVRLTGGSGDWYYHNSGLYISGRWFEHGDVLWLDRGKHPVLRRLTVGQLCDAHGRHHLYDEVWLRPLDDATVQRARAVRNTERQFRRKCLAALAPQYEALGRPDVDALLWLPLARHFMALYCRNAIGDRGWHCAGQCYTQHPMLVAMPFAHAWRNATGTEVTADQHLGWFLGQAAMRTVFADEWARMQDYGRGGGPVGVDLFGRGFGSVPPAIRPAVAGAWRRTLDLTDRKCFHAPEGAVEELDPMSAAFTLVNVPADSPAFRCMPPTDPADVLPRAMVDRRRLGYTMRNRWQDGDDIVALFTGFRHPGGDWGCEGAALDLRLMGLGAEWIVRGNGHVGDATSTVEGAGAAQSDVRQTHLAVAEDGSASVSLAYSAAGGRGLRCFGVDYSGASGAEALLVLVDKADFTPPPPAPKPAGKPVPTGIAPAAPIDLLGEKAPGEEGQPLHRWRLVTDVAHTVAVEPDGFRVASPGGAVMKGTFVAPRRPAVRAEEVKHRIEINYRYDHQGGQFTRKVISADGKGFFFVIMTLGRAAPPTVSAAGQGADAVVTVGNQTVRFDGGKVTFGRFTERR